MNPVNNNDGVPVFSTTVTASADSPEFPKDFSLNRVVMNPVNGDPIDLRFQMLELNVHEDIFNNGTYGTMVVTDARNQIKNLPIYGFETLNIDFNTPGRNKFKMTFRVYKITDRFLTKERLQVYAIHFTSPETFTNVNTVISKSYKGMLISDIANDIQKNILNSSFNVIEPTKFLHQIVIPNWNPMKAMNWLTARANSSKFQGSNYLYFQNNQGFNFVSVENLVSQPDAGTYFFQPVGAGSPLTTSMYAVENYQFKDHINVLQNISNGMYGNNLTTHNLVRKRWDEYKFTYGNSWSKYTHMEANSKRGTNQLQGNTFLSNQASSADSSSNLLRLYPTNMNVPQDQYYNHVEDWLQIRISQIQQLQNVCIHATVPGDSQRTIGDMVTFNLPSPEPLDNEQLNMDWYYQGRYLVTAVRHTINRTEYDTIVELTKDSLFSPLP